MAAINQRATKPIDEGKLEMKSLPQPDSSKNGTGAVSDDLPEAEVPRKTRSSVITRYLDMLNDKANREKAILRSQEIDRRIACDAKRIAKEVRIVVFGSCEYGTWSIIRFIISMNTTTFFEMETYRSSVFSDMLGRIRDALETMEANWLKLEIPENETYISLIQKEYTLSPYERFPEEYSRAFRSLWADAGFQRVFEETRDPELHKDLTYYFDSLDRLFSVNYTPANRDVFRVPPKKTVEFEINLGSLSCRFIQPMLGNSWKRLNCFENVHALFYIADVSAYDQCLINDRDANKLQDTLMNFESICNSQWFISQSIILFLNNSDSLKEKLATSNVRRYFPDYSGDPNSHKDVLSFFGNLFRRMNRNPAKEVYLHFTNPGDYNLTRIVISSVQDMIITKNLARLIL